MLFRSIGEVVVAQHDVDAVEDHLHVVADADPKPDGGGEAPDPAA